MALFKDKIVGFIFPCFLILGCNIKLPLAIRGPYPPYHSHLGKMAREIAEGIEEEVASLNEPVLNIRRLRKDLMSHYDKFARPIKDASAAVPVSIHIQRLDVVELNELEERMVVNAVMDIGWKDEHLQWNPHDYSGITSMIFGENDIWRPDVIVLNSAPITENCPWNNTKMLVSYDGTVYWYPPASISVRCQMSPLKPTDERFCNITIGSYSYVSELLNLKLMESYTVLDIVGNDNPIWKKTNLTASLETYDYSFFTYSDAVFTVGVKRKYNFTGEVVRGPTTVAILLILSMFWLPSSSDKKLNLGCLVLLVLSGIIMYLSSTVASPSLLAASVAPVRVTLFAAVSALLIEVIILNLSRLSDIVKPSPIIVRILSGMVGRIIGVCPRLEYREESGMVRLPEPEEESSQTAITIEEEWALVAMTLDRIFFIIYSIIFIAIS